jgi:serine/threonine protein kinase
MIGNSVEVWKELSTLYEEADALDPAELNAFLERLEAQANPLLVSLRRMLDARSRVAEGDFLGRPPSLPEAGDRDASQWRVGAAVGPYRLLRHLGSGGMAEVWLAERADGSFERTVAIKLLFDHPAQAQRRSFVERFRRERDILAALDHPRIARLHDAGVTPSGQPWLAIEAVDGEAITAWCDRELLSVERRVQLFREVLDAVEHAHAHLIIHRDIKPSNVLVGRDGTVRLLDFGISKLLEAEGQSQADTALTHHGGRPLTPEYASPEQLRGESLTTACDIYSLGVLLHELLVGERPDHAGVPSDVANAVVIAPSRRILKAAHLATCQADAAGLRSTLRPDLDAIVIKALEPLAERRYESVGSLRADLDRWVRSEPVLATVPGRFYSAGKFLRRHRVGASVAAVVAALVVSAAALIAVQGGRAQREALRASASKDFLLDMFQLSDPNQSRGSEVPAGDLLDASVDRARRQLVGEPELRADVLTRIAEINQHLGRYTKADTTLTEVASIYASLGEQQRLVATTLELADNAVRLGDVSRAERLVNDVIPSLKRFEADRGLQARAHEVRGWLERARGNLDAAKEQMSASLSDARAAFGDNDVRTSDALLGLAVVQSMQRDYAGARVSFASARESAAASRNATPIDKMSIEVHQSLVEYEAGEFGRASTLMTKTIADCDATLGAENEDCFLMRGQQAVMLIKLGSFDEAMRSLPSFLREAGNDLSPARKFDGTLFAYRVLGANGRAVEGKELRDNLVRFAHGQEGEPVVDDSRRAAGQLALAEVALREGRPGDAAGEMQRLLSGKSVQSLEIGYRSRAMMLLGLALQAEGRYAEALTTLAAAEQGYVDAFGMDHTEALLCRLNRIPSLIGLGEREQAGRVVDSVLPTIRTRLPPGAPILRRLDLLKSSFIASKDGARLSAGKADFFD